MNNMDHQSKQEKLKTLTKSLFLKHVTQLLLLVSLLSLLVTNFSSLSFLCSFNSKFSTFPIQLFTHTLNKNYTFLICNGIVVFVAKISSSRKFSQSKESPTLETYKYYDHQDHERIVLESRGRLLEKEEVEDDHVEENGDVEKGREDNELYETTEEDRDMQEEEKHFNIRGNEEEKEEEEERGEEKQECEYDHSENEEERELEEEDIEEGEVIELDEWSLVEEEEDEDGGNGVVSTEELNKRIDEFIKKMKEGLRMEAQQQYLVMVN